VVPHFAVRRKVAYKVCCDGPGIPLNRHAVGAFTNILKERPIAEYVNRGLVIQQNPCRWNLMHLVEQKTDRRRVEIPIRSFCQYLGVHTAFRLLALIWARVFCLALVCIMPSCLASLAISLGFTGNRLYGSLLILEWDGDVCDATSARAISFSLQVVESTHLHENSVSFGNSELVWSL
jgi:hypothetical protein